MHVFQEQLIMGSVTEPRTELEPDSVSMSKFKETFFLVVLAKNRDTNGQQTSTLHMWRIIMTSHGVALPADNKGLQLVKWQKISFGLGLSPP